MQLIQTSIINLLKTFKILCFAFLFFCTSHTSSFAYLDPGTGSMILQIVISVVVGAGITIKIF